MILRTLTFAASLAFVPASFAAEKPVIGEAAPEFSGQSLAGSLLSSGQFKGQGVNLLFIDSLCPMPHFPNCEQKIAKANRLAEQQPGKWIAVASHFYVNEDWVKTFSEQFEMKMPVIFDDGNVIFERFHVYSTPYKVAINEQGVITYRGDTIHN